MVPKFGLKNPFNEVCLPPVLPSGTQWLEANRVIGPGVLTAVAPVSAVGDHLCELVRLAAVVPAKDAGALPLSAAGHGRHYGV